MARLFLRRSGARQRKLSLPAAWPHSDNARDAQAGFFLPSFDHRSNIRSRHWSGKIAAYAFSTVDIIDSRGYSGTPFDVIAGVDLKGVITGAKVVFHTEPIIVEDPARQRDLDAFLARESGRSLTGGNAAAGIVP